MWASISACLIGVTGACEDHPQLGAPRLADGAPPLQEKAISIAGFCAVFV